MFYALVYDDDNEYDAGLSSGAWTNLKLGGTSGTKRRKFLSCPSTFLALQVQLVVFVSAFVMISTVWSISCFLFYSLCPHAQSFVKVGARAPVPWIESASLSCYSFTPESIIKQPFNLNA